MDQHEIAQVIFSADPAADYLALHELEAADAGARLVEWLEPGVGWATLGRNWSDLARRLDEHPPIWMRHIFPVQVQIPVAREESDLDRLVAAVASLAPRLNAQESFSVQTRLLGGGWPYHKFDVNRRLSDLLEQQGAPLDVRAPVQVVSVVLTPGRAFLGLSRASENLSDWAGGEHRFKREEGQVSRAEFKLLEALEMFGLELPAGGKALDLGAAPGGWTRILLGHGMRVVAVDPGDLDPRVQAAPAVTHVRQTAQRYLSASREQFDVILDDMRLDARESAEILVQAAPHLAAHGWALVTLKLPETRIAQVAEVALDILRRRYAVTGARQLFHNRNEITVALRPRPARG